MKQAKNNGANLGFEARLWAAADKLRGNMEPSDYKHVALGLIFLKYISDAFEARRAALLQEDPAAAEDPDFYLAENVFWVPREARWKYRLNETAEEIARLIFKDWFVNFGPIREKMEGRTPYLDPKHWELFPDALDEEGKPTGWVRGTLADIVDFARDSVKPSDVPDATPYIGLKHMPRRSIVLSEWEGAGTVTSNKTRFRKGDILFGKLAPYFHKVGAAPVDGICSTDIVVAVPRSQEWDAYSLACLSSDEFVNYADRTSSGTVMPRTNQKTMARYKICLPPECVVRVYRAIVQPLLDRLGANIHETSNLSQTRDILLPKLMLGEVRLRDAEEAAAAVA